MKKIMNRSLTVLGLAGVASLGIFTPAFGTKTTPAANPNYIWKLSPSTRAVEINESFPGNCILSAVLPLTFWNSPASNFELTDIRFGNNANSHPDLQVRVGATVNPGNVAEAPCNDFSGQPKGSLPRIVGHAIVNGGSVRLCPNADVVVNTLLMLANRISCTEVSGSFFGFDLSNNPTSNQVNLDNYMAHEYGHVGGLAHLRSPVAADCIMNIGPNARQNRLGASTIESPCVVEKALMDALH